MNSLESPKVQEKKNEGHNIQFPPTPCLKKIGYGTGVHVYQWDRSKNNGEDNCSPWALKKMYKQCTRLAVTKRIEEEANILKELNHPNIVGFRGYKKSDNGYPVLAMEECGVSLGDLIEERREAEAGPFKPDLIHRVIVYICKALHYIHVEKNIIHGDLKSYNILIKGDFEQIKLCDFGVSYPIDENGEVIAYVGTLCWSGPEVIQSGPITSKSDIYAFGLTIWEMLSLQPPHSSADITSEIESQMSNESQDESMNEYVSDECLYGTRPSLPSNLGTDYNIIIEIFKWCTESEPSKRPSAMDILMKLQNQYNIHV